MDEFPLSYSLFLLFILLFLSAFFCVAEGSLFSLGRHHRESIRKEGKKTSKLIEKLLSEPYKLIITILFADEVVNVAYTSVIGITVKNLLDGYTERAVTFISIAIASPTLLLIGEIAPKTLGVKFPRLIASIVIQPLHLFHVLITPIRWVLMILSIGFTRILGGKIEYEHKMDYSPEEVKALVGMGSEEGVVSEIEQRLVSGLFRLETVPISKIMVPNVDVFNLPIDLSPKDAVYEVKKRGFSRVPVYRGDKENITGILYAKDLISINNVNGSTLEGLLRKPYYIPRTKIAFDLLDEFQAKRIHMAVVVDEYGRVDGIVTMEDILEEVFGEIEDERIKIHRTTVIWNNNKLVVPGSMKVDEFNDTYLFSILRLGGLENLGEELQNSLIPSTEDNETVGGFVFDQFGRLPSEGESVKYGSLTFSVNGIKGKRISEIMIMRQMNKRNNEVSNVA